MAHLRMEKDLPGMSLFLNHLLTLTLSEPASALQISMRPGPRAELADISMKNELARSAGRREVLCVYRRVYEDVCHRLSKLRIVCIYDAFLAQDMMANPY